MVRFIAVVGGSGSGKSWLADRIRAAYGAAAGHLSLDDFYRDLGHLTPEQRAVVNFDDPASIDWDALRAVMLALESGGAAGLPAYDFATHTRKPRGQPFPFRPVIVVEGLWLLHPEWLREKFTHSLFVDCPESLRLQRRIDRDVASRGRTEASVREQFAAHVEPMHALYVQPQREWSQDVIESPADEETITKLLESWEIGKA
ncbi:MAG: uridine kinase [Akkermansiaceae bacterium]|nr:uridine kinase [Akkermansiaceae bacterium]